jgi:hypothetical protein
MLETVRKEWRSLRAGKPGQRFQERYRRHRASRPRTFVKVLMFGGGLALLILGIVFMVIPGPGIPIAALGAAFIANESRTMARMLDGLELRVRKMWHAVRA